MALAAAATRSFLVRFAARAKPPIDDVIAKAALCFLVSFIFPPRLYYTTYVLVRLSRHIQSPPNTRY